MDRNQDLCSICGNRVKELREAKGYSLKDLGDMVDMTRQGISRIENGEPGKTRIRKYNLKPLSIALKCEELYLTGKTDEIHGTGIIVNKNGKDTELVKGIKKIDFEENLTKRLHEMGPVNAQLVDLFFNLLKRIKPEEQQWLEAFFKTLPSYKRYKSSKKHFSAEYIIAEMYDSCFTRKTYENIYQIISEEKVTKVKKMRLAKDDFIEQMYIEFGDRILESTNQEMKKVLDRAFSSIYSPYRVRKGPLSRIIKK
ncbi:hypothetical protein LAD12857_19550 [Lacrimispora amygdalina]|uniref:HTH cro/C1-type domain-containing protein n=1 Tax=Lacrimispora amygdalina TaxID=253257 RepID=A0ABQ5M537_9FIRM